MRLYQITDEDNQQLWVIAENLTYAVTRWRQCWNDRALADGEEPYFTEEDEPKSIILVAEGEELYL